MRSSFNDNMGPTVKDSPPSSPGSESMSGSVSGRRKRRGNESGGASTSTSQNFSHSSQYSSMDSKYQPKEEKEPKLFDNGVNAPHMLGNQLNPNSSMAQKMSDTLSQELKAHSIFTEAGNSGMNLVGPPLHSRVIASAKASQNSAASSPFSSVLSNSTSSATGNSGVLGSGNIPQTLDQLLERQWEQGSQFLMDQAQHFDIASLLSCLHQLRAENLRLEENVNSLLQRRDHLLAVNARLAIPLTSPPNNSSHTPVVENGLSSNAPNEQPASHSQFSHRTPTVNTPQQQSTTIRHASGGSIYQGQSSNLINQNNSNNSNLIRNNSGDMMRNIQR
ncbi:hypothetical protein QAD02_005091 [Eretmocerus hayati]|uniref:Uncharacterized protein n=1 Tax=Eretmocerus hayati TaxID=131215 RepID=A0ACC2NRV1_9HYME|nr:hypothetical protein QAD02_005091 [Eretmocerus hayati]